MRSTNKDQIMQIVTPKQRQRFQNSDVKIECQTSKSKSAFEQLINNPKTSHFLKNSNDNKKPQHFISLGSLEKAQNRSRYKKQKQNKQNLRQQNKTLNCVKHPNKLGSYLIVNENKKQQLYCQKCSIELASQGYCVRKITKEKHQNKSHGKQSRRNQKELYNFMNFLQETLFELKNKQEQAMIQIIKSQSTYGDQINQINEHFKILHFNLEVEKNRIYNKILKQKKQTESQLKRINSKLEKAIQKISKIKNQFCKSDKQIQLSQTDVAYYEDQITHFCDFLIPKKEIKKQDFSLMLNMIESRLTDASYLSINRFKQNKYNEISEQENNRDHTKTIQTEYEIQSSRENEMNLKMFCYKEQTREEEEQQQENSDNLLLV